MTMHFSVDDFIDAMLMLKNEVYQSIFEQPAFAVLKRVHEECGAVFSCYCFYETAGGNLGEVPSRFTEEFQANADWLRFGFHSYNTDSNYGSKKFTSGNIITDGKTAGEHYAMVIRELIRITGGGQAIDRYPRIHYYAGIKEDCQAWKQSEHGIIGLIAAEDDRVCYYHDEHQWEELIQRGFYQDPQLDIGFWRTCIRLENMENMAALEKALKDMEDNQKVTKAYLIFTHEKFLAENRIEDYFVRCGRAAKEKGIEMGYFYE